MTPPGSAARSAAFFEHKDSMEEALRVALGHSTYVVDGARNENERAELIEAQQAIHDVIKAVRRA